MSGQFLLLGVEGHTLSAKERALFTKLQPGGYVLFGRNVESAAQVRKLTDALRELTYDDPIIAIDQEGGRVSRTKDIGLQPPSAQELRIKGDSHLMALHGELTADVLRLLGFNHCLAPVLDISYDDEANNALRGRCWGTTSQEVMTNAGAYNRYLRKRKMTSCAKHFPSCGLADVDPHHDLPWVDKQTEDLYESDVQPYLGLLPELDAIMTSHVHFSALDAATPGLPGSLSKNVVTGLLRDRMGYEGVIMTDDLDMGAVVNTYGRGKDIQMALEAGNDMAMVCHKVLESEESFEVVYELSPYTMADAEKRIKKLKKKLPQPTSFSENKWKMLCKETKRLRREVLGDNEASSNSSAIINSPVEGY